MLDRAKSVQRKGSSDDHRPPEDGHGNKRGKHARLDERS